MRTYLVGGAVRDQLLGRSVSDRDYVVVGASPEEMIEKGFKQVGSSFPVFLHPETGEEYALARTERKTGDGYHGFKAYFGEDVTLEEDLKRRDLTINAMAMDLDTGEIIDPYGGRSDLGCGIIRHVSEAFAEDPLRVLRVARFIAKLTYEHDGCQCTFTIAPETMELMANLVGNGEMKHLTKERVWKEIERGLEEENAGAMFEVLRACGAIHDISLFSKTLGGPFFWDLVNCLDKAEFAPPLVKMIMIADASTINDWKLPKVYVEGVRIFHESKVDVRSYPELDAKKKVDLVSKLVGDHGSDKHGVLEACVYASNSNSLKVIANVFQMLRDYEKLKSLDLAAVVTKAASQGKNVKEAVLEAKMKALS
jgi:hypothetical protein